MGVEWIVSRRGTMAIIWSDNGTNFVGAERELRENIEKWNTINIAVDFAHKGIRWRFNPPSAPQQGDNKVICPQQQSCWVDFNMNGTSS